MAVTFHSKITLCPGFVFCFGTISSVADEEGTLHRIADPPKKKSPPTNSENVGVRKEKAQPPALQKESTFSKPGTEGPLTRRTPLSTSPAKEWTRIARKKERNKRNREEASCSFRASALEGERKKDYQDSHTILPRRSFHRKSGVAPRLRRRTDRARRRTTSAGIPSTEKPAPKYPAASRGRRAESGAACLARRGLRDRRNSGGTHLQRTKELPTARSPASSRTSRAGGKTTPGKSTLRA
jgi:hypothetical protein